MFHLAWRKNPQINTPGPNKPVLEHAASHRQPALQSQAHFWSLASPIPSVVDGKGLAPLGSWNLRLLVALGVDHFADCVLLRLDHEFLALDLPPEGHDLVGLCASLF